MPNLLDQVVFSCGSGLFFKWIIFFGSFMKIEITSTLPFGNSKYVTKGQTNDYRVLQLEKNSQGTLSSEEFFKNKFFILEVKIPPDLGENKF